MGRRMKMCLADNTTPELWKNFMQSRKEIKNQLGPDLYSLQIFDPVLNFKDFDNQTFFEKWAAVEVSDFDSIPNKMECYNLPGGLYAVFIHKGPASEGTKTFQYIFETWLPNSGYQLDNRPHFELLGEKYKNNEWESEEEVWIPVKFKK